MKKLLLLSSIVCVSLAQATDIVSETAYGVSPVTSSAKATMVAVPFVGSSGNIQINQMVKAKGLTAGDMIYALPQEDGNTYQVWKLVDNSGTLSWEAVTSVSVSATPEAFTAPDSNTETLARGNGFWLVRKDNPSASFTFYVNGNVSTNAASAIAIDNGWNLVGQSSVTGTKTLADIESAVGTKGSVRLNGETWRYLYTGSAWYKVTGNNYETVDSTTALPVGEGFWIVRKAAGSADVSL